MPWGYAMVLSDIRVTLADGSEVDCLRKIYPVAENIVAGFAGSVWIGFHALQRLGERLVVPEGYGWDPSVAAEKASEALRAAFDAATPEEQDLGAALLLASVHPTENNGDSQVPRAYVHTVAAPTFEAKVARGNEVASIGSGASTPEYEGVRRWLNEQPHEVHRLGMNPRHSMLPFLIRHSVDGTPAPGISPHMHVSIVERGRISSVPNNMTTYAPDGSVQPFAMPPVASTHDELVRMLEARGSTATHVAC